VGLRSVERERQTCDEDRKTRREEEEEKKRENSRKNIKEETKKGLVPKWLGRSIQNCTERESRVLA
jgi:uncharacterized protein (UPF0218 family)